MIRVLLILSLFFSLQALANGSCQSCHEGSCNQYEDDYSCKSCHGGISGTSRKELAHYKLIEGKYADFLVESAVVSQGAKLVDSASCRRCHIVNERGNHLASNLDITIKRLAAHEIDNNITAPNEQMPVFNFSPGDSAAVVTALLHYSSKQKQGESMIEVVHFNGDDSNSVAEIYNTKCGGCHRMLSAGGALGSYTLGPFLSGLYSEFYPPLNGERWNEERLSEWLDNPRKIKGTSVMPIPALSPDEKSSILKLFSGEK